MKNFLKKYWIYPVFIVLGILGGYLYWYYIGCNSGTCPITSLWYNSSLAGAVFGYFTGDLVNDYIKKKNKQLNNT